MSSNDTIKVIKCIHPEEVYQFGPADSYYYINIPVLAVNGILLPLIIFGNFNVILAYCRNTSLQTVPNMLLISLAFTDLFVGLAAQPLFMAVLLREVLGAEPLCWLALLSSLTLKFCGGTSLMTLSLIISLERYLALCHPFKHRLWITKTVVKRAVLALWLPMFLLSCSLMLGISYSVYFLLLTLLTFLAISVVSFACCSIVINLHMRRNNSNMPGRVGSQSSAGTVSNYAQKRDYRIAVTMFYIIGAVMVCYTPMFAAIIYAQVAGSRDELYLKYFYPNTMTLVFLNSLLNPVIYCLRNSKFASAIRTFSGSTHNRNNNNNNNNNNTIYCNNVAGSARM